MKKLVLVVGLLLGMMMIFTACDGNGDNAEVVESGDTVSVEYTGMFEDGEVFDSSSGQPLSFQVGAGMMIPGFDSAVVGMEVGESQTVTLPPDQAYGEAGFPNPMNPEEYIIPPNATLIFEIEIVDIVKQ